MRTPKYLKGGRQPVRVRDEPQKRKIPMSIESERIATAPELPKLTKSHYYRCRVRRERTGRRKKVAVVENSTDIR